MLQAVLRQIAEGRPLAICTSPPSADDQPGEQTQQGGLAGAVLAAQADPLAGADVPVDAVEDSPAAKILVTMFRSCSMGGVIAQGGSLVPAYTRTARRLQRPVGGKKVAPRLLLLRGRDT